MTTSPRPSANPGAPPRRQFWGNRIKGWADCHWPLWGLLLLLALPGQAQNATAALPDLKLADVANAYSRSIVAELAPLHPKRLLLDADPDAALEEFERNSVGGRAVFSDAAVAGMPFKKAIRVDTDKKPQEWQTHLQSFTPAAVQKGDVLYVTAYVRAISIQDGRDAGQGRIYASMERGGNQANSSPLGQADFAIPENGPAFTFPWPPNATFSPATR